MRAVPSSSAPPRPNLSSTTRRSIGAILGELRRFCRDTAWPAHVPRGMQERVRELRRASDELAAARGCVSVAADLATELGWAEEDVVETMVAAASRSPVSLERWRDDDQDAGPAPCDHLAVDDPGYALAEDLVALRPALRASPTSSAGCSSSASSMTSGIRRSPPGSASPTRQSAGCSSRRSRPPAVLAGGAREAA